MEIYIHWDAQVYFTSLAEAREYYEREGELTTFNDFLADNYGCEEIFNFTENERLSVMEDYKDVLMEEVVSWLENNCDIVKIEAKCL